MKGIMEMRLTFIGKPSLLESINARVVPHLGIDCEYESVAETITWDAALEWAPNWDYCSPEDL